MYIGKRRNTTIKNSSQWLDQRNYQEIIKTIKYNDNIVSQLSSCKLKSSLLLNLLCTASKPAVPADQQPWRNPDSLKSHPHIPFKPAAPRCASWNTRSNPRSCVFVCSGGACVTAEGALMEWFTRGSEGAAAVFRRHFMLPTTSHSDGLTPSS